MKVKIKANGESWEVENQSTIPAFLEKLNLKLERVIVEHNGEALTRSQAADVRLSDGDTLEIVRIVAGG